MSSTMPSKTPRQVAPPLFRAIGAAPGTGQDPLGVGSGPPETRDVHQLRRVAGSESPTGRVVVGDQHPGTPSRPTRGRPFRVPVRVCTLIAGDGGVRRGPVTTAIVTPCDQPAPEDAPQAGPQPLGPIGVEAQRSDHPARKRQRDAGRPPGAASVGGNVDLPRGRAGVDHLGAQWVERQAAHVVLKIGALDQPSGQAAVAERAIQALPRSAAATRTTVRSSGASLGPLAGASERGGRLERAAAGPRRAFERPGDAVRQIVDLDSKGGEGGGRRDQIEAPSGGAAIAQHLTSSPPASPKNSARAARSCAAVGRTRPAAGFSGAAPLR